MTIEQVRLRPRRVAIEPISMDQGFEPAEGDRRKALVGQASGLLKDPTTDLHKITHGLIALAGGHMDDDGATKRVRAEVEISGTKIILEQIQAHNDDPEGKRRVTTSITTRGNRMIMRSFLSAKGLQPETPEPDGMRSTLKTVFDALPKEIKPSIPQS